MRNEAVLKILLVDDDRVNRILIRGLLRQAGYQVIEAESGEVALQVFAESTVDIVLMDVLMPGISGFEAASRIKEASPDRWVPIVFLSGLNERASRDSWIDIGDDFLSKPVDDQLLKARMRSLAKAIIQERQTREIAREMALEQRLARQLMERISFQNRTSEFNAIETHSQSPSISSGDCIVVEGSEDNFYIFVADAMGHGLAAAVTLMPAISIFHAMALKGFAPDLIAREINHKLRGMLPRERFISAVVAQIDRVRCEAQVCNAGLPLCLLVGAEGEIRAEFDSSSPPLGVIADARYIGVSQSVSWRAGEHLLVSSDGFSEAFGEDRKTIRDLISAHYAVPAQTGAAQALWAEWQKNPTLDDATLVVVNLQVSARAVRPASDIVATDTLVRIALLPSVLRRSPGAEAVLGALQYLGCAILKDDPKVALVLTELIANALDHGLLLLNSGIKNDDMRGMDAYFQLRSERLERLTSGSITVEVRATSDAAVYEIDVKDSGRGFDVEADLLAKEKMSPAAAGGRGLSLLRGLCEKLTYAESGTRAMARVRVSGMETVNAAEY